MAADKPLSFGSLEFHLTSSLDDSLARISDNTPFRIMIAGDFSGRANRAAALQPSSLSRSWQPIQVDRDNLEELPSRLGTGLSLTLADSDVPLLLCFEELEDFHPDRLFDRLGIFKKLRQVRRDLQNSATFHSAAIEFRSWQAINPSIVKEQLSELPDPVYEGAADSGSLLDKIMAETEGDSRVANRTLTSSDSALAKFLQSIVSPHLIATDNPQEEELVATVDGVISALMRAILHHADFQTLEAAWRGLSFLLTRLETDEHLQVFLLDLSKEELSEDLMSGTDLSRTAAYNVLVEKTVETQGAEPWAVVLGAYAFGNSSEEAEMLGRIARISARAGAPFLAAGSSQLVGCDSLAVTTELHNWRLTTGEKDLRAWSAMRALPEASFVGLALLGLLLRLPYGDDTDPIDRFSFEEIEETSSHGLYLWGNPVFVCGCLLGQAFSRNGWQLQAGEVLNVERLPLHVYKEDGEKKSKPCAEILLTQKAAEKILEQGLMPLLSFKDQDKVRLARFQSIAAPLARLSGPWS